MSENASQNVNAEMPKTVEEAYRKLSANFFTQMLPDLHKWWGNPAETWTQDFTLFLYGRFIMMYTAMRDFPQEGYENGWGTDTSAYYLGCAYAGMLYNLIDTANAAGMTLPKDFVTESSRKFRKLVIEGFDKRLEELKLTDIVPNPKQTGTITGFNTGPIDMPGTISSNQKD